MAESVGLLMDVGERASSVDKQRRSITSLGPKPLIAQEIRLLSRNTYPLRKAATNSLNFQAVRAHDA